MNELDRFRGEGDVLTMGSVEIAKVTGKTHKNVRRDMAVMLEGIGLDKSNSGHIYRDSMNRKQEEYRLPKDLTLTLVMGYDVQRRHTINQRWLELEEKAAKPQFALP